MERRHLFKGGIVYILREATSCKLFFTAICPFHVSQRCLLLKQQNMDPAINQTPVEDLSAGDWKAQMKSGKIELEKCLSACDTRDLNQFRNQVQKSFRHLGDANVETLLDQTVLESCWVEGARCLLEQGANPNTIPPGSLIWQCRSLAMLQLLAEFGMDYKSKTCNILG